jgi:DNA polymerase-3 subunit beta
MRFNAKASDLATAAAAVAKISPTKNAIPILRHTLVRVDKDGISLIGHDLDRSLVVTVVGDASEPGAITIDAKRFAKLLAAIDGETTVIITADEKALTLQAGRSRYKLETLPAEDFPLPLAPGSGAEMVLDDTSRPRILDVPKLAMATEETRYYLCSTALSVVGNEAIAVGTNGHWLARSAATVAVSGDWPSIIIPRPAVTAMAGLAGDRLITDGRIIQMTCPERGVTFASKLIDATYPDWSRVVPSESINSIELSVDELLAGLARLKAVAGSDVGTRQGVCRLEWSAARDAVKLSLSRTDAAEDVVSATVGEFDGRFACAIGYLVDALHSLNAERAIIDNADERSPIRITAPGRDDVLAVIMPMRW